MLQRACYANFVASQAPVTTWKCNHPFKTNTKLQQLDNHETQTDDLHYIVCGHDKRKKKKKKYGRKKIQLFQEIEKLSQIQPPTPLLNISWRMGEARPGGGQKWHACKCTNNYLCPKKLNIWKVKSDGRSHHSLAPFISSKLRLSVPLQNWVVTYCKHLWFAFPNISLVVTWMCREICKWVHDMVLAFHVLCRTAS